jgi:hypothetical protein
MDLDKRLAISMVMVSLSRNGYYTYEDVPMGAGLLADIFAARKSDAGKEDRIVVEVKAIPSRTSIPSRLESKRLKLREKFGHPVYYAFFIENQDLLIVDAELQQRMRFRDDKIRLEVLPAKMPELT